jgi:hypothetical protein
MKVKFGLTLCVCAALGLGLASCNKDKESAGDKTNGQESVVKLTVYDQRPTRGTGDEEQATAAESAVSGQVKVKVFNSAGVFEKEVTLNMSGTGPYVTEDFTLSAGTKYIYAFFNDGTRNDIVAASGKTRVQFEQSVFETAFDGTTSLPDIATDNSFLMGTLYGETKVVSGGGTATSPVEVNMTIGRAIAKVNLKTVTDATGTGMPGSFTTPSYRVGSLAKKVFAVGQYTLASDAPAGTMPPVAGGKWTAFSAVHNEPPVVGSAYNDAAFLQYAAAWKAPDASFYVTENTTVEDGNTGYLYYGNTSYVQVRTKYTPDATEVLDPTNLANTVTLGADFWTVQLKSNGARVIVGTDPQDALTASTLAADVDTDEPFYKYTGGLNYHKFAIYDDDPTLGSPVQKYLVLRNTYYEYEVTDILTLGSWTEEVDPEEPVPTNTELKLIVTIKPWFKIADNLTL